jgi:hypothetical protein
MGTNKGSSLTVANSPMNDGDWLTSQLGYWTLTLTSGQLQLKDSSGDPPIWTAGTGGHPGAICTMQGGGMVAITPPGGPVAGVPDYWDSPTNGYPSSTLIVEDDGHVIIFNSHKKNVWEKPTSPAAIVTAAVNESIELNALLGLQLAKTKDLVLRLPQGGATDRDAMQHQAVSGQGGNSFASHHKETSSVKLSSKPLVDRT